MYIAIVSDSHGAFDRLEVLLSNLEKAGIKHLIHAGDFAVYGVAEILARFPQIQILIARGNCDVNEEIVDVIEKLPNCEIAEVVSREIGGVKIAASHVEGIAQRKLAHQFNPAFQGGVQVFCHGHTHRAKKEEREGNLVLNPGALMEDGKYFLLSLPDLKVEQRIFSEEMI